VEQLHRGVTERARGFGQVRHSHVALA
jgi:hypothetical protein